VQIPCQRLGPFSRAKELIGSFIRNYFLPPLFFFPSLPFRLDAIGRWLAGRVFCKKGCNADGDTWEECEYAYIGTHIAVVGSTGLRAELFGFRLACSGSIEL